MNPNDKTPSYADIFADANLSEWEKYKYFTKNDKEVLKHKEKVRQTIIKKGLSSVMNDTKWLKLQSSIERMPFPPPYIAKLVLEDKTLDEVQISDSPRWVGDWSPFYQEGMPLFFEIEYIKVRPFFAVSEGRLVQPKIQDARDEFEALLNELHIPYQEDKGTFTIYGYQ